MVKFIDVHSHLCSLEFTEDIDEVIQKAKEAGVQAIFVLSENHTEVERVMQLADLYPGFCLPCLGVHPLQPLGLSEEGEKGYYRSATMEDLEKMIPYLEKYHEKLVALGEVGLDFTPKMCPTDVERNGQRAVLREQIKLAKKYDLPLNVHSRSASKPTITLLEEEGAENVLLHAFDGRPANAMIGVKLGYYFSIPPSIIRSDQKNKLLKNLPLDSVLFETDSPALGPEKQERNEPKNITISCQEVAKIKGIDIETCAAAALQNTLKLFPRIRRFVKI